mmetsp:Transcript_17708/g.19407  ORF Transcript_17708/g.19407 Transcript_17708/m.19407 type:complete len:824 (-) Transcript_17708:428-2899(-)
MNMTLTSNQYQNSGRLYQFRLRSIIVFALLAVAATAYLLSVVSVIVRVHQQDLVDNKFLKVGPPTTKNYSSKKRDITALNQHRLDITTEVNQASRDAYEAQIVETKKRLKEATESKLKVRKDKSKIKRPGYKPKPHGHGVQAEIIVEENDEQTPFVRNQKISQDQILTAYLEITNRSAWGSKPFPLRNTKADDLIKVSFPKLNSCSRLTEQFPVDDYPDADPFLPWIHDVFPTHDGKWIQIVAQNKRRCKTGKSKQEKDIYRHMSPQISLFQHVAVKRMDKLRDEDPRSSSTRYRLASHEEADQDGMETRFICRFSNGEETLSVFNFSYEWASYRKKQQYMFHEDSTDNKQIHTSQLLFRCPVPTSLVEIIRTGTSIKNDFATIFLDIVPIRTPARYGPPNEFLPPYYKEFQMSHGAFDPAVEWGNNHTLPLIENSGRWQNIPICKPSLLTYGNQIDEAAVLAPRDSKEKAPVKQNRLVSCLWASAGYSTRGERYAINDGQRRLLEWITYNKLTGVEHFYIYDNSQASSNQRSLQLIADIFPEDVTLIKWPSKVCNNNPNNVDSVGERSSQYAAESSCRLRFGPHANWIGQFDIDEYLIPMGNFSSLLPLLDKLDEEGNKIVSFASWRAWPRRIHINDPEETTVLDNKEICSMSKEECFELSIKKNTTIMEAYNCDRQKPGKKSSVMPAEKQIYKPEYVKQHFIHYSTVTETTELAEDVYVEKYGTKSAFPDPLSRFGNEMNEGLMLHSKAIARQDTAGWKKNCHNNTKKFDICRIGIPFPDDHSNVTCDKNGWEYNCYVNPRIENYWVPLVKAKLKKMGFLN